MNSWQVGPMLLAEKTQSTVTTIFVVSALFALRFHAVMLHL